MNGIEIYKKRLLNLLSPIEVLDIVEWAEKYIETIPDSPYSGTLNLHRTPFLLEPLKQTMSSDTKLSVLQFPVQVGKSLILKLLALYNIVTDPSPILFLADTSANSEDFCDTSLTPMIKQNKIFNGLISNSAGANMKETKIFTNGAVLWNRGASNLKNLQRRSVKLLLADECWLYPNGHLEEAVKRTTRFLDDGGRAVLVSQAGEIGGEFNNYYEQTNQQEFMWKCPNCGEYHAYNLDMIKWDKTAIDEEGNIDFQGVKKSLVYFCKSCSSEFLPNKEQLKEFNQNSVWFEQNPTAPKGNIGFHTTAFCFLEPFTLLTEYLNACSRAKDGDFSQLKIFTQKRLATPWAEQNEVIYTSVKEVENHTIGQKWDKVGFILKNGKIITKNHQKYKNHILNGALPLIFMAVDVQKDHFYYVIRAFGENPQDESMLIECGILYSWDDIFSKKAEFMIPNSNMGIDSGFRTQEVYAVTVENPCYAMKGHEQRTFKREAGKAIGRKIYESHTVATPQTIQIQTQEKLSNGGIKTRVRKAVLLSFSANAAKDWVFFNRQRTQRGKAHYDTPQGTPEQYEQHMNSEKRVKEGRFYTWRVRKNKIANHYLDCETMIYSLCLNLLLTNGNHELIEYLI